MTRFKAYLIHLGISAAIFLALAALILFVWYPQPYFADDGGWQGIRIVALVDLVLGPGLTFIVFKAGKPGLKFDLTLIALAQTAALAWGLWTVYDQRPVLVTFVDGEFYTMTRGQVEQAGGNAPRVLAQSAALPGYAFVRLPEDPAERRGLRLMAGLAGTPPYMIGERFDPLDATNLGRVLTASLDIQLTAGKKERVRRALEALLAREQVDIGTLAFLPLHCRYNDRILVLRRADGRVMGTLPA